MRLRVRVSDGGDSYLDMWKNASERERKSMEFQNLAEKSLAANEKDDEEEEEEDLEKKSEEFEKILEVSKEERDRIQRMQVVDRAAAAIAAARALLEENASMQKKTSDGFRDLRSESSDSGMDANQLGKLDSVLLLILISL